MHGGTLTRCKYCPAVIALVRVVKAGERDSSWMPIDVPPVLGRLGGETPDRLVIPRLQKIVACRIITPEEARTAPVSDLILGSVPHWATCERPHQARQR